MKNKCAVLCLGLVASIANAQESLLRPSVPDYDQRRSVLPRNGSMYCVPTSYVNVFRYMSNHGMPAMNGPYSDTYNQNSNWLLATGVFMGTDAKDGTNFGTAYNYAKSYINNRTAHAVYHYKFVSDDDWGVNTIRNNLRLGAIINIGRGRYEWDGNDYDRVGGHMLTLVGYASDGSGGKVFKVMNPAEPNDGELTTQSPYAVESKATGNITVDTEDDGVVTHARYTFGNPGGGNNFYMIDFMHVMLPVFTGWPDNNNDATTFTFEFPFQWDEAAFGWPKTFQWTTNDAIVDWQWDVKDASLFYATTAGAIKQVDIFDNTVTTIATIPNTKHLVLGGRKQDIYIHSKAALGPDRIHYLPRKGGFGTVSNVGFAVAALDYDEFNNGPVVVDTAGTTVKRYSPTATSPVSYPFKKLQSTLPTNLLAPLLMKVDQLTGDVLTAVEGTSHWTRYKKTGGSYVGVDVPIRGTIDAFMPGDNGRIYVQSGDRLSTWLRDGTPDPGDFDGMEVTGKFKMTRGAEIGTNPMTGEKWHNEDGAETP